MITVLVHEFASGGGFGAATPPPSILAEGRAMRDAVCRDLASLPGVRVLAAGTTPAERPPNAVVAVPAAGEAAADFLRRKAAVVDAVWLVAPESAGIALGLAQTVEATGIVSLGCPATAIAVASSKSLTLARLAAAGIATVSTWPLAEAPLADYDAWVIKPDIGCGCEGMRRLPWRAAEHLRRAGDHGHGIVAQPWLAGEAMSLSLLVLRGETELLSVNRQCIAIAADGSLSLTGIELDIEVAPVLRASLRSLARRAVDAIPGLAGFVGIDFILAPDGRAIVLEVNARLTSAYVGLSRRIGRNLAAEVLRACLPEFAYG